MGIQIANNKMNATLYFLRSSDESRYTEEIIQVPSDILVEVEKRHIEGMMKLEHLYVLL